MKIRKYLIMGLFSLIIFNLKAQFPNYKARDYKNSLNIFNMDTSLIHFSSIDNLPVLIDFLYDTSINSIAIDTSLIDFKGLDNRAKNLLSVEKIFWDYTEKPPCCCS